MNNVIFLFLRRVRTPLLVMITAYAISIGGLVLIPGVDSEGNPWHFTFFHAFYFVSYMSSTIGFGELPHEFTDAQRMWVTFTIYLTVIGWLYSIGTILALIQDPAFKRALTEQRFTRAVKAIGDPFYLVCGYGETGSLLVRALTRRNIQTVVIELNPESINNLTLEDLTFDVPSLCADARESRHLIEGGLLHPKCLGVVAITDNDQVNVKIAVTSKLLNPPITVIARAGTKDTAANLASFNTDHIINPFNTFGVHLAVALRAPSAHLLHDWLISTPNQTLHAPVTPPHGHWIVCGYGRLGRAVCKHLQYEGIGTSIIEAHPDRAPKGSIVGTGTEAVTLREAGVEHATGIIAGTETDADNLSIVMTARDLNPELYVIARLNRRRNQAVYRAADVELIMQASRIIVWRILPLLTVPLLSRFLHLARHRNECWAKAVLERVRAVCDGVTPHTWSIDITAEDAGAVCGAIAQGRQIRLRHLLGEPQDRSVPLPCVPLLLERGTEEILLPEPELPLAIGDQILFSGQSGTNGRMAWILVNPNVLEYMETGEETPDGYFWRWLSKKRHNKSPPR